MINDFTNLSAESAEDRLAQVQPNELPEQPEALEPDDN